jgi:hypothetical protein
MKLTQDIFNKIKASKNTPARDLASKHNLSVSTVYRVMQAQTLEEAKHKGGHKEEAKPTIVEVKRDTVDSTEVAKKIGVSQVTVSRVRSSVTLSEAKHKGGHKATEERKQKPSIVRTTENKKSVIKTTITGGEAKIEIIPKKSLFSRLFRRGK